MNRGGRAEVVATLEGGNSSSDSLLLLLLLLSAALAAEEEEEEAEAEAEAEAEDGGAVAKRKRTYNPLAVSNRRASRGFKLCVCNHTSHSAAQHSTQIRAAGEMGKGKHWI